MYVEYLWDEGPNSWLVNAIYEQMIYGLRGTVTKDTGVGGILKVAPFIEEICECEEFIIPSNPTK